jgi:putative oxidoreductase
MAVMSLARLESVGLLLLRLGFGLQLALQHGWGKMVGVYGHLFLGQEWGFVHGVGEMGFPLPLFFAVCVALAEFVGGMFLALGLFTRYAAVFVIIDLTVAVTRHLFTNMRFELASLYLLVAVFLLIRGAGSLSLDRLLQRSKPAQA